MRAAHDVREPDAAFERAILAAIFVLGFGLRFLFADGGFIGDDAWYFYLARDFGRELGVQAEQPWFHLANRPLYYAIFHLGSEFGLLGFRLLGTFVGALIPCLAYATARALGATRASAAIALLCLCLHRFHLQYSALGFPDLLASAFALAACLAAAQRRATATLLFSIASVASKESFVLVPFIATFLRWEPRERRRPDALALLTCLLPTAYIAIVSAISLRTPGLRMQGWSQTPFSLHHARAMLIGPELWPLLAWLVYRRQFRAVALWIALPLFYLAWNTLLGRGMAPWYAIGPASLASVAVALAFDSLALACRSRSRAMRYLVLGAALACLAPMPLLGLLRVRAQWVQLHGHVPHPDPDSDVQAAIERSGSERVLLVDCFWAYRYSHLRSRRTPAEARWWYSAADSGSVLEAAQRADVVVVCRKGEDAPIRAQLERIHSRILLENERFSVLEVPSAAPP
ncbi:MAG TPA: hypothetical protein VGI70_07390 [Polyangiales bacterium]|jgi:hypothetical protein